MRACCVEIAFLFKHGRNVKKLLKKKKHCLYLHTHTYKHCTRRYIQRKYLAFLLDFACIFLFSFRNSTSSLLTQCVGSSSMEKINTPEKPYVRSKLLHGIIMVFKKRFPGTKKTKRKKGRRNVPCSRGFNLGVRAHTRTYIYIIPSYVYITIVFASKVRSDNENRPTAMTYIERERFREPKKNHR